MTKDNVHNYQVLNPKEVSNGGIPTETIRRFRQADLLGEIKVAYPYHMEVVLPEDLREVAVPFVVVTHVTSDCRPGEFHRAIIAEGHSGKYEHQLLLIPRDQVEKMIVRT